MIRRATFYLLLEVILVLCYIGHLLIALIAILRSRPAILIACHSYVDHIMLHSHLSYCNIDLIQENPRGPRLSSYPSPVYIQIKCFNPCHETLFIPRWLLV
jgi:hypothetical protein